MRRFLLFSVFVTLCTCLYAQRQDPAADSLLIEFYQSQKYTEAARFLKDKYAEPVTNLKIVAQLAYAANMANKLPEAEAYYQRLYNADSTSLPVLFNLAGISSRRGNNTRAVNFYKRMIRIDSTNFSVYKQLAQLAGAAGDVPGSITYLQKANHLNPQDGNVAFDLAALYINLRLDNRAESVISIALKADTANLLLLKGKAQVSYAQKKYQQTVEVCRKLIAGFDRSSQVISYKGISEFNLKKYNDCIKTFGILDSAGMQNETSYYYLGLSYKQLKDDSKAIFYFQKATNEGISPNTGTYYSEIGDSYDHLHLSKRAVAAYQRGLTFGEMPLTLYALAAVYDGNLIDTLNAIKYYKRYLSSKPPVDKQRSYVDFTTKRIAALSR